MEIKHTPGPWMAHWMVENKRTKTGRWYWTAPNQKFSGQPEMVWFGNKDGESAANAKLVAAAPEMLQALRMLNRPMIALPPDTWMAVWSAIAKATGKTIEQAKKGEL